MNRFFVNKYPLTYGTDKEGVPERVEVGTAFFIVGISGNMFELEPVTEISSLRYPLMVDCMMLERGFNGQEHAD